LEEGIAGEQEGRLGLTLVMFFGLCCSVLLNGVVLGMCVVRGFLDVSFSAVVLGKVGDIETVILSVVPGFV